MLYQDNCRGKWYYREFSRLKCIFLDVQYKILSIFMQKIINTKLNEKRSSTESCWEHVLGDGKGNKELGHVQSHVQLEKVSLLN